MGKKSRKKKVELHDRDGLNIKGFGGVRGFDGAQARTRITGDLVPTSFGKSYVKPPTWEGTYSFKRVFEGCERQLNDAPPVALTKGEDILSGADLAALTAMKLLHNMAHPIFIGSEQFNALPEFEIDDLGRFLNDARLPFEWVYFDFSSKRGPTLLPAEVMPTAFGALPTKTDDGRDVAAYTLAGALMGTFGDFNAERLREPKEGELTPAAVASGFTVFPFGTTLLVGDEERGPDRGDGEPMDTHAPLGMVTFGHSDVEPSVVFGQIEMPQVDGGEGLRLRAGQYRIPTQVIDPTSTASGLVVCGTAQELRLRLKSQGWVAGRSFPFGEQEAHIDPEGFSGDRAAMQNAAVCYWQAVASLRALYLLAAQNVEVVDAELPRQARRQAERKGYGIAKVVRVRATKVGARRPPSGARAHYSHRFERRGVFHHVRRGRAAKPDHMTPCYRRDKKTGELTCPDGCRKVWHPPHWVGDEGPMIPKTRIWPGQDDPQQSDAA